MRLNIIELRFLKGLDSSEIRDAGLRAESLAWHDIVSLLDTAEDRGYTLRERENLTENDYNNFGKLKLTDHMLIGVISYRDKEIPLFDDNYGQQVFTIFDGDTISAGAYNFEYLDFILLRIDEILDKHYLENFDKEYHENITCNKNN